MKLQRIATGLVVSLLALAAPAIASGSERLALSGDAVCPSRALVSAELKPLLRDYQLVDSDPTATATVTDLGESYSVTIPGAARTVRDPGRRCLERARVVAVFIALNLPSVHRAASAEATEAPRVAPADPPPQSALVPEPPDHSQQLSLRLFGFVTAAPQGRVVASGAGLGLSRRFARWRVSLAFGASTAVTPQDDEGRPAGFEMLRLPGSALVGWEEEMGRVGLGVAAGLALDVVRLRGVQVPNPDEGLRANAGLRLEASLRLWASRRLAAVLLPEISYFPRTYRVRVAPARVLGETPHWWFGASLGLEYGF